MIHIQVMQSSMMPSQFLPRPVPSPYNAPRTHHNGPAEALVLVRRAPIVGLPHHLEARGVRGTEVGVPEAEADGRVVLTLVQRRREQAEGLRPRVLVEDVEVCVPD